MYSTIFPPGTSFTGSQVSPASVDLYTECSTSSRNITTSELAKYCTSTGAFLKLLLVTAGVSFFAQAPLENSVAVSRRLRQAAPASRPDNLILAD